MTLSLLLAARRHRKETVILAAAGGSVEPLLAGVASQLGAVKRIMFPLPDDTTQRHVPPPAQVRRRHADLWHALSADERARVLLVAGPTAAYLTPVVGSEATAIVALRDLRDAAASEGAPWRAVLGPFQELDEVPEDVPSEQERDEWLGRIRAATAPLELVRDSGPVGIAGEVATALGLGPKAATRAATATAAMADKIADGPASHDTPSHWVDEVLHSLSRPPRQQRARKRQRVTPGS